MDGYLFASSELLRLLLAETSIETERAYIISGVVDISDILLTSAKDVFASKWVESLRLEPHPLMSNCYYKETYK